MSSPEISCFGFSEKMWLFAILGKSAHKDIAVAVIGRRAEISWRQIDPGNRTYLASFPSNIWLHWERKHQPVLMQIFRSEFEEDARVSRVCIYRQNQVLFNRQHVSGYRLPREAVDSPSLEIFKTCLDKVLCSLLWVTLLLQGGWTRWPTEVPSTPNILWFCNSVILWFSTWSERS